LSADLGDLKRLKITAETRAWLQAEAHSTGKSHQEIARDILHAIALEKISAAKVLVSMAPAERRVGDTQGHDGDGQGRARRTYK
jgi:hypothetical protein